MEGVLEVVTAGGSPIEVTVAAACAGDREAFERLVLAHLAPALATASFVTGSEADGADAVQNALLHAWLRLDSLHEPAAFPGWFRTLVVRSAIDITRRRRSVVHLDLVPDLEGVPLSRALEARALDRALARLEPKDRAVLGLRHLWDLPGPEVARILGIPEGTVKSRLHAAIGRLRAAYEAEDRA